MAVLNETLEDTFDYKQRRQVELLLMAKIKRKRMKTFKIITSQVTTVARTYFVDAPTEDSAMRMILDKVVTPEDSELDLEHDIVGAEVIESMIETQEDGNPLPLG